MNNTRTAAINVKSLLAVSVLGFVALLAFAPAAKSDSRQLWQVCDALDSEVGECQRPAGVATDPTTGDVYVVDSGRIGGNDRIGGNQRILKFSPWGELVMGWGGGVRDGSNVPQTCGPAATPPSASCLDGIRGGGVGQFANPQGVAVDSAGNVYVHESKSCESGSACEVVAHTNRVQKLSPDGDFILTFGREVNLTKVAERKAQEAASEPVTVTPAEENLCTAASGNTCGPGTQGSGNGEFGTGPLYPLDAQSSYIAIGPGNKVEVGGQERIQVFDSGGHFESSIPVPGKIVGALAVDAAGSSFASFSVGGGNERSTDDVVKLDPSGNELCRAKVADPRALAIDAQGRVYVASGVKSSGSDLTIHRFSSACVEDEAFAFTVLDIGGFLNSSSTTGIATSSACGIEGNLYYANSSSGAGLSLLRAYYPQPNPVLCPPPPVPPSITEQYATSAGATSAIVEARINPRFWPDTTYYVQYGTEDCAESPSACEKTALFPGAALKTDNDEPKRTAGVFLSDLAPDTTYHYRFVAQSGGGGPAFGVGEDEADATLTTYPLPGQLKSDCPNQAFRAGASAALPDCRAYEMVSPLDKQGGDILPMINGPGYPAALNQGAASGDRLTYSTYRAFGEAVSGPYTSQYLARRGQGGWSSEPISPFQEGASFIELLELETNYKAFDEELCNSWVLRGTEPQLAPGAIPGYANLYRRDNCAGGSYEAATTVAPIFDPEKGEAPLPPRVFTPEVQGFSADGSHVVFSAQGKLTENAPACGKGSGVGCPTQVYDYHDGDTDLVCVLPNGTPSQESCSAGGSTGNPANGRNASVFNAVSADGSRIFWTSSKVSFQPGKLYLRVNGEETILISSAPASFWGAAPDASRVFFSTYPGPGPGDLYETAIEGGAKTQIAGKVLGVMGMSEDARRVYFASREAIAGTEENSEGATAQAGEPNLYLYEAGDEGGGTTTYVASLAEGDASTLLPAALQPAPIYRTSRVTPSGLHAAFTSAAPLTGADNIDAVSGEPVTEVFLYDATEKELRCVSCNPSGARPKGREFKANGSSTGLWIAGSIPGWANQFHPSRVLSEDGNRLFFESVEPLVLADTNGKKDVYEWEAAQSAAECDALGAQLALQVEGGCLSLISSGDNPADSSFVDAGASGRDVFFTTNSSLLAQDPGLIDVYDAREGGGFPAPPTPPAACEGEACQGAYVPPDDPTPASSSFEGAGNVAAQPKAKARPKAKPRKAKHAHKKHKRKQKQKARAKRNERGGQK